ncbi:putative membrane protein, TIGR04086 family [Caminicella sporogenes DSM 14501]|uniref:Putative membrane protein, TIGR04086 family n=1 Tax=Caminicella sporogenes DSM 14501 TaxID=1121266 RepID=A0A1M6M1J3_9FIRM|nr:TIGR04086 family membrane protein [Caminicella sporogenes]RKD28028.1 hypothetical protein BET04_02930 [Caminicella sporogenes]SHJ77295.1 putative membrane protein, TIGR04086 family [Caminicella sporogenes DSM 14501]
MPYGSNAEKKDDFILLIYLKSIVISMAVALVIFLILAAIVTFTSVSESIIPLVSSIVTVLVIAFSGLLAAVKKKKKGFLHGIAIGALYVLIIFILSLIFIDDFSINKIVIIKGIIGIVSGGIGGIIGVNLK